MANDLENWTLARLLEYEQALYDAAVEGDDDWHERDLVIWELNRRGFGDFEQEVQPPA